MLLPGEKGSLNVTFESGGYFGDVTKWVYALSDASREPIAVAFHVYATSTPHSTQPELTCRG
jgi:hypothetical protein